MFSSPLAVLLNKSINAVKNIFDTAPIESTTDNTSTLLHETKKSTTVVKMLCEELKICPAEWINLWNKGIDDEGAMYLSEFLKEDRTITCLDLGNNNITSCGFKAICESLEVNQTLRSLTIYSNKIDDSGIEPLCKALGKNRTLRSLDIERNNFTIEKCKDVIGVLEINDTIEQITFVSYYHYQEFCCKLRERLWNNEKLNYRRKIGHLLLLARSFSKDSVLHEENLPLDVFKIIFKLSGALKYILRPRTIEDIAVKKRKIE